MASHSLSKLWRHSHFSLGFELSSTCDCFVFKYLCYRQGHRRPHLVAFLLYYISHFVSFSVTFALYLTFFLSLSLHYSLSPLHFLFLSLTSCLCPFISANLFSFMPERHLTAEWKGLWQQSTRNARALQGNFSPDIVSLAAMRTILHQIDWNKKNYWLVMLSYEMFLFV